MVGASLGPSPGASTIPLRCRLNLPRMKLGACADTEIVREALADSSTRSSELACPEASSARWFRSANVTGVLAPTHDGPLMGSPLLRLLADIFLLELRSPCELPSPPDRPRESARDSLEGVFADEFVDALEEEGGLLGGGVAATSGKLCKTGLWETITGESNCTSRLGADFQRRIGGE